MKLSLDELRKLQQKKYRQEFGAFLAEGEHLVLELQRAAVQHAPLRASQLYVTPAYAGWESMLPRQVLTEKQMSQICDTRTPQGIVALVPLAAVQQDWARPRDGERAVYLHEIQDPGNLGSILRTLAWFGGFRCLLGPNSVDPFNPKTVRASMGAVFHVPVEQDVPLEALPRNHRALACLDLQGEPLCSAAYQASTCLVFGNEARGLPRDQLQALGAQAYRIPGCGAIESLNLAAAVQIGVYELCRVS
jgi:TrmH family RNA methyltransferase